MYSEEDMLRRCPVEHRCGYLEARVKALEEKLGTSTTPSPAPPPKPIEQEWADTICGCTWYAVVQKRHDEICEMLRELGLPQLVAVAKAAMEVAVRLNAVYVGTLREKITCLGSELREQIERSEQR